MCPHLREDKLCNIYGERFAPDQPTMKAVSLYVLEDEIYTLYCSRIPYLIGRGMLHPDVEAVCCYAHPELLEENETLGEPEE